MLRDITIKIKDYWKKEEENTLCMTENAPANNSCYGVAAFLSVVVFVVIYKYTLNMYNSTELNDIREHAFLAESIYANKVWEAWLQRPYLMWHLCVKGFVKFFGFPGADATACTCGVFAAMSYYATFFIVKGAGSFYVKKDMGIMAAFAAALLAFVQPFYVPWFNQYHYEGQFSINPLFNPTHMAVKVWGLLTFALVIDIIRIHFEKDAMFFRNKWLQKGLYPIMSIMMLISAFAKPTFIYMFIPTGVLFLMIYLVSCLIKKDGSWKNAWNLTWKLAAACVPSIIYLLIEYAAFYLWGGTDADASVAIYPFLSAWHVFSPDVPTSIVHAMAFPLWMLLTNFKYFVKTVEGRFGLLAYVVGTLEFSFFVETGTKFSHLNFAWPMMSGMLLFWVMAAVRLTACTKKEKMSAWNVLTVSVGWILFAVHFFSGLYYINPYQYII